MPIIGLQRKVDSYQPIYKFSKDDSVKTPTPSGSFEAGLVLLLGECLNEVRSGAQRELLILANDGNQGLSPDQRMTLARVISLYNEVVGYFPKR